MPDAVNGAEKTVAPSLQYPIRAEARTGSAPDANYSQIPGTTLTSHADPADAHGVADVQGAQQPGAATYGNMHSDSSSTVTGTSVKAVANSVLHDIDIVTFTSGSTVDNFFEVLPDAKIIAGALLASIGPTTSEALRRHGRKPDIEASAATIASLCDSIVHMLTR